ncbi:hypothetical protein [Paenibacillus wynnii]|uniref:hypothetical protein n=1 Tax=Paenibacillus wynnii TaxID=268407 RepID=UPI00278F670B|nr:hypothetical protein [Paenibacillus wynnii]MDQ0194612.1 hypothetical protein [Paenibacillus wynnii]
MAEELIETLRSIQDRKVRFIRLVGNSLIIYCDCEPGNQNQGFSIWLEPTWHFRNTERVITGSREAQTEDEIEHSNITEQFKSLYFKAIQKITIEPITNDVVIEIEEGNILKTFVSDPNDEESWQIRNFNKGIRIIGNPRDIQIIKDLS